MLIALLQLWRTFSPFWSYFPHLEVIFDRYSHKDFHITFSPTDDDHWMSTWRLKYSIRDWAKTIRPLISGLNSPCLRGVMQDVKKRRVWLSLIVRLASTLPSSKLLGSFCR
jgi:hypothetical protein